MKEIVLTPKTFSLKERNGKVIVEFEGETFEFDDYNYAGEFIESHRQVAERRKKKMAQYCKIAGKVTNCTENCKFCLEEETNNRDIKVGDKVRYIAEDLIEDKESGYYPPKGTIGTVIWIGNDSDQCYIRWPEGTTKGGVCRYTEKETVELV